ncbi:dockerin type I domain-containing protein [Cuneatibacter caecimuris]|uniref:Beta-N-acetylglucosaminidase n=1 Tax=Cuneatibacter caecimuris TaxID=1796618 RepID=A0A4Q7PKC6_9FIRM|nr:dockerin type I domain-containing protein [Cuneatibacter caecimuris]RZT00965.1 beta-N-acetylglucosaminidase [Cuneatibacter caecimuris]
MRHNRRRNRWKALTLALTVALTGCLTGLSLKADNYTPDEAYRQSLRAQGFPEDYLKPLDQLHQKHPNWVFQSVVTGIDWKTFIDNEDMGTKSLISNSDKQAVSSWKSLADGAYNWETSQWTVYDGTGWVRASRELVEYYADPRNQFGEKEIFQFLSNAYHPESQNEEGLQRALRNTFMASSNKLVSDSAGNTYTYVEAIMDAAEYAGLSPYAIGTKIRLEQGVNGNSGSISGNFVGIKGSYAGLYNYFNHGAYNANGLGAIENGLIYARGDTITNAQLRQNMRIPWTNQYDSILGGAYKYADYTRYGQDTNYFEKFNVVYDGGYGLFYHQYFTHIRGANSLGIAQSASYEGMDDIKLVFRIPVYLNMPSAPCPMPTRDGSPNYKLADLSVNGYSLTPTFNTDTLTYSIIVDENVSEVTVSARAYDAAHASISGTGTISLKHGQNEVPVTVTAGNGTKRTYTLLIARRGSDPEPVPKPEFKLPDYAVISGQTGYLHGIEPGTMAQSFLDGMTLKNCNAEIHKADGSINTGRIGTGNQIVIMNSSGESVAKYQVVVYGDVNGDGKITAADLGLVQRHVLHIQMQEEVYFVATDVNRDQRITAADMYYVQQHILHNVVIPQGE